jgi:hypothetical protein
MSRHTKNLNFSFFYKKKIFKKIWTYRWNWLEKCYYWWNFCRIDPRSCPEMAVFRLKKGHFQQLISRRKKLTLARDPHQWKIWTFYLPRIPSLGTNGWPRKCMWIEPTLPLPKMFKYTMNSGGSQNFLGIICSSIFQASFNGMFKFVWKKSCEFYWNLI